jgi:hypothetical protein
VLERFEIWLTDRTIQAEPRALRTAARRAWNKAANEIKGWPQTHLSLQSRRQLLLPFTAFPAPFQADVASNGGPRTDRNGRSQGFDHRHHRPDHPTFVENHVHDLRNAVTTGFGREIHHQERHG